jgi:hypothetical protein
LESIKLHLSPTLKEIIERIHKQDARSLEFAKLIANTLLCHVVKLIQSYISCELKYIDLCDSVEVARLEVKVGVGESS